MRYVFILCVTLACFFSCHSPPHQPKELSEAVMDAAITEKSEEPSYEKEQESSHEEIPKETLVEQREEVTEQVDACVETQPRQHLYLTTTQDREHRFSLLGVRETKENFLFVANFREEIEILGRKYKTTNKEDTNILFFSLDHQGNLLWIKHLQATGTIAANDFIVWEDGSFWLGGSYTHDWEIHGVKMLNTPRSSGRPKAQAFVLHFDKHGQCVWGKAFEETDELASTTQQILLSKQKSIKVLRLVFTKDAQSKTFLDSLNALGQIEETRKIRQKQERGWISDFDIKPLTKPLLNQLYSLEREGPSIDLFVHQTPSDTLLQVTQDVDHLQRYFEIAAIHQVTWQTLWKKKISPRTFNGGYHNSFLGVEVTSNQTNVTVAILHIGSLQMENSFFDSEPYQSNEVGHTQFFVSFYNFSLQDGSLLWQRHWLTPRSGVTSFQQQDDSSLRVWGTATWIYDIHDKTFYDLRDSTTSLSSSYVIQLEPQKKLVQLSKSSDLLSTYSNGETDPFVTKHHPHPFSLMYAQEPCFMVGGYKGYLPDAPQEKYNPAFFREHILFFFAPPSIP